MGGLGWGIKVHVHSSTLTLHLVILDDTSGVRWVWPRVKKEERCRSDRHQQNPSLCKECIFDPPHPHLPPLTRDVSMVYKHVPPRGEQKLRQIAAFWRQKRCKGCWTSKTYFHIYIYIYYTALYIYIYILYYVHIYCIIYIYILMNCSTIKWHIAFPHRKKYQSGSRNCWWKIRPVVNWLQSGEGHVVIAPVSDCHSTVFHGCIHPDVNHQCLILDQANLIQSLTIIWL